MAIAGILCAGMIFIQLVYWKYAAGEWLVYSYQDQSFTWIPPHIEDVLWSARAGWLVYSPMMIFAVIGLFMLRKRLPEEFPAIFLYCMVALYITSAWDIWWYGGSLGQRAMVQAYPLWAFGLGAVIQWAFSENKTVLVSAAKASLLVLAGLSIYLNLWWTHQAHHGGLFKSEQMTRAYMLKILGKYKPEQDWVKFLDTRDEYKGAEPRNLRLLLNETYEADTLNTLITENPISGKKSLILRKGTEFSHGLGLPLKNGEAQWLRAYCQFRCESREDNTWRMTNLVIRFWNNDKVLKDNYIRLQRHVNGSETRSVFFDTKVPKKQFDRVTVFFWNPGSEKTIVLDDLKVEAFD
jgi:hypothetical protein